MADASKVLPIIKDIMYSKLDLTSDTETLKNYLKYYRMINQVLIEALEPSIDKEDNSFMQTEIFKWYCQYIKTYDLLLQTDIIAKLGKSEKKEILSTLESLEDINELDSIIDRLNLLKVIQLN